MVLSEATGAAPRRHEQGHLPGIAIPALEDPYHVPGGEDERVALPPRGIFPAPVEGLLGRFGEDLCREAAGLEGCNEGIGVVSHMGDVYSAGDSPSYFSPLPAPLLLRCACVL